MLRRTTVLFLAVVAVLTFAGCRRGPVKVGESDAGKTITIKQADILLVSLPGNPTTGFNWEVGPDSKAPVKQDGEAQFKADSKAIGAGGIVTLKLVTTGTGTGKLQLFYHRTWEKDVPPAKTFEINLVVQ